MEKKPASLLLCIAVTAVWMVIELFLLSKHEIWLDEAQHWLLARDSSSLSDLYRNMQYEGHPPLWNLLLFVLACFTDSPLIMQLAHLAFAGGTVFLIVKNAPFPLWVRLCLPFTFFLGYEYAIIARNYAPAVFFILLGCSWAKDLEKNILRISIGLGLATCFHLYAGVVAAVMLGYFLLKLKKENGVNFAWKPIAIFSLFGVVALWFLVRVPSDHFMVEYRFGIFRLERLGTTLLLPFTSLMHFPEITGTAWWNTNIFLTGSDVMKGIIGLLFWSVPVIVFRKNPRIMVLYIAGAVLLSAAMLLTPMFVTVRHAGFMAVLFFVCLWLSGNTIYESKLARAIIALLLIVQVSSYFVTAYKESTEPFSQAENVARFVQSEYRGMKVAIYPVFVGPPVSANLGSGVFYQQYDRTGSFADWSQSGFVLDPEQFILQCKEYIRQEHLDSLVVIGHEGYEQFEIASPDAKLQATFTGAAVEAENYKIYILTSE